MDIGTAIGIVVGGLVSLYLLYWVIRLAVTSGIRDADAKRARDEAAEAE